MERLGKRILLVAVSIALSASTRVLPATNKLVKAEHHTNNDVRPLNIELGTLVFYFERDPVYKVIENQSKDKLVFEFSLI